MIMIQQVHSKIATARLTILALVALLIVTLFGAPAAGAAEWTVPPPPMPAAGPQAPDGTPGTIYYGAIPLGGGTNKPVLLFVQGMHGQAVDWWGPTVYYGTNNMYAYAYNYGYRTAFVELWDSSGTGHSMWDNGSMLKNQINTITAHYGVSSLNIVAHSKGGIDTQTAIVHYGAYPRVQRVFTLSTPHWGSPLADLCYSSWTWWIAELFGQRDDATYVLQTGYMNYFRSITDNRSENNYVRYYTSGGTDWGPLFSGLWWGGSYLSFYGSNDGLVVETSTHNPRGTHVFTRSLNHDNIRIGSNVFPTVNNYVSTLWRAPQPGGPAADDPLAKITDTPDTSGVSPFATLPAATIIRGGPLAGATTDEIIIEPGVQQADLDVLSVAGARVSWTAPDGRSYDAQAFAAGADEYFRGATHYTLTVGQPAPGAWRVTITPADERPGAYALIANLDSPVQISLARNPAASFVPGSPLDLTIAATAADGRTVTALSLSGDVALDGVTQPGAFSANAKGGDLRATVTLPGANGVANLSLTIRGALSDGSTFEREVALSVAVVAPGQELMR
jgi:hypothetical protein